jgi:hypothetical protein
MALSLAASEANREIEASRWSKAQKGRQRLVEPERPRRITTSPDAGRSRKHYSVDGRVSIPQSTYLALSSRYTGIGAVRGFGDASVARICFVAQDKAKSATSSQPSWPTV